MKPSQRHARDAQHLLAFRNSYVDLLNHAKRIPDGSFSSTIGSNTDHATWQQKRQLVASAAGAAGAAYDRFGGTYTLRNAAYITHHVDPVTNWHMSLEDPDQLRPDMVISSVDAAIATANREAQDAAERERGLTGFVAAFLRWPTSLREAVGPDHPAQRRAAGAIGVIGQIAVGTLTAALASGLVAGVVALWRF